MPILQSIQSLLPNFIAILNLLNLIQKEATSDSINRTGSVIIKVKTTIPMSISIIYKIFPSGSKYKIRLLLQYWYKFVPLISIIFRLLTLSGVNHLHHFAT